MTITADEVQEFIHSVFGGLDDAIQELLGARLRRRVLACGETLWEAGSPANDIAFVLHGRLLVTVIEVDGDRVNAGEIGRGQAVGVAELVGRRNRVATVTAMRESELLLLGGADFDAIVARAPAFVIPLMRSLATRLSAALRGEQSYRAPETIAVLPLGPGVPLGRFAEGLAAALEKLGTVHVVDAERVDQRFGPGRARSPLGGALDEPLGAWLDELDDTHDVDLYLADVDDTPWTRRCLERADRIVLVGAAGEDPAIRPIERLAADDGAAPNRAHRELVMIQRDDASAPVGTAAWLAGRSIERLHHVRLGKSGDFGRVARRITHRSVGLVLSGGAARGMVHIGVIRGLLEGGVPIDAVGGTSAGGGVAALLAAEYSPDDMVRGITDSWLKSGVFSSPRVPIISLFEGESVRQAMQRWLGERQMEDLWRDCFVAATNLNRARLEVIDRGPVWHALLSTAAIPGLLPPTFRDGEVLVDGGVLDNLPLAVMRRRNPGRLIASDVGDASELLNVERGLIYAPTNASLLLERLNPFDENTRVPTIVQTLYATLTTGSRVRDPALLEHVIYYFRPDLSGMPALAFKDPGPLLEAGYRAAQEAIAKGAFAEVIG